MLKLLPEIPALNSMDSLEVFFNTIADSIFIHDLNGVILKTNTNASKNLLFDADELIGKNLCDLISGAKKERFIKFCSNLEVGQVKRVEDSMLRKDGSSFPVEVIVQAISIDGEIFVMGVARDISQRIELEEKLRQSQKIEAVGQMAGGLAHELNNRLAIIILSAQNGLLEIESSENPQAARDSLEKIEQIADKSAKLTQQILAYSRKQVLSEKITKIENIVSETLELIRPIVESNISLICELENSCLEVRVDHTQFQQVIMNLVINARDAMPNGGRVVIKTSVVDRKNLPRHCRDTLIGKRFTLLSIEDTGLGMTQETMDKIFEPFFSTKEVGKGTGLGLPTVLGILRQSGCDIQVQSEINVGTKFQIYIPEYDADELANERLESRGHLEDEKGNGQLTPSNTSILLVDDEDDLRKISAKLLSRKGFHVVEVDSGEAALKKLSSEKDKFDFVITDVMMTGISGAQLAEKMAETQNPAKIIFISGYTKDKLENVNLKDGQCRFVQKPFSIRQITEAMNDLLKVA